MTIAEAVLTREVFRQRVACRVELRRDVENEAEQTRARPRPRWPNASNRRDCPWSRKIRERDLLVLSRLLAQAATKVEPHHRVGHENARNHPQCAQSNGIDEPRESEDDPGRRGARRIGQSGDERAESATAEKEVGLAAVPRRGPYANENHGHLVGDQGDQDDRCLAHVCLPQFEGLKPLTAWSVSADRLVEVIAQLTPARPRRTPGTSLRRVRRYASCRSSPRSIPTRRGPP